MSINIEQRVVRVTRNEAVTEITIRPRRVKIVQSPVAVPGGYYYVHEQATPATPWTVIHGFGKKPSSVSVLDLNDNLVEAEYQHMSTNLLQVRPLLPATGRVIVGA